MKKLLLCFVVSLSVQSADLVDFHEQLMNDIQGDEYNDSEIHNRKPSRNPASVEPVEVVREEDYEESLKDQRDATTLPGRNW